jgi:hypothetical protein
MQNCYRLALLAVTALVLSACGGGGGGSTVASIYAGTYTGAFTNSNETTGTGNITIAQSGSIAGTIHHNQEGWDGSIHGTVRNDGTISGTTQYTGQPAANFTGTVTQGNGGNLTGNIVYSGAAAGLSSSFVLTRN